MAEIKINTERCKACGYCLITCRQKVLGISDIINIYGVKPAVVINVNECSGCSLCAHMCPETCIEIWK